MSHSSLSIILFFFHFREVRAQLAERVSHFVSLMYNCVSFPSFFFVCGRKTQRKRPKHTVSSAVCAASFVTFMRQGRT